MTIRFEVRDRIAYMSLTRPEKHNAIRDQDLIAMASALRSFDADDLADVGILYGQGRSFSSGSDVGDRVQRSLNEGGLEGPSETDAILNTTNWKPLIAAVDGYCLGQGLALAFLCDLVVATTTACFQLSEAQMGVPTVAFVERLGGIAPLAMEAGLTGRFFSAEEAKQAGIISKVVDEGQHVAAAEDLAGQILQNPQGGVRELVRYLRAVVAERLQRARNLGGQFDWVNDPESRRAVEARITQHRR